VKRTTGNIPKKKKGPAAVRAIAQSEALGSWCVWLETAGSFRECVQDESMALSYNHPEAGLGFCG
jgi:hypothetical protein